ncbi:Retrovirus-related Pol polyprotein, partial [Mucuna pruriens]
MINIFSNLLEDCIEVFMDNFIVYVVSFEACLENVSRVLTRCIETNLMLNFEKCYCMVTEGVILGHLVSNRGIEVDKAKVDIITSLSNPTSMWEVCSFPGHADHPAFAQAASERCGLHLWLVLHGGLPRVEEVIYHNIDSLGTELGVSVQANV